MTGHSPHATVDEGGVMVTPSTESPGLVLLRGGLETSDPRAEVLEAAARCVLSDRQAVYGAPENNFSTIAALWRDYLAARRPGPLAAHDVAAMMVLMKVARLAVTPEHRDSWVDTAGYAACGARCTESATDDNTAAPPEGAAAAIGGV